MKILFLTRINITLVVILVLIFSSCILFSSIPNTYAAGGYGCFFSIAPFDKQIYQPGETVTIRAVDCSPANHDQATLIIADGMGDLDLGSPILANYENGKNVIYEESKQTDQNGISEFNFTIPQSSNTYRYIVLLKPYGIGGYGMSFFFTKPDANKIKISDVQILNPNVNQGDNLKIGAKITDGLGNPLPFFNSDVATNYRGCFPDHPIANEIRAYHMSDADRQQYYSTGMVWNWIQIPQGYPGTYSLNITADNGGYEVDNGFEPAQVNGLQYNVLGNSTIKNEMHIFPDHQPTYMEPRSEANPDISPNSTDNHLVDYAAGDQLYLTDHDIHNSCVSISDEMPTVFTIKKMNIDLQKTSSLFGPNSIRYGSNISCYSHPELCTVESANSTTFNENPDNWFSINSTLLQPIEETPGEYIVDINATYRNQSFDNAIDIRSHDVKEFPISEGGKSISVFVDNWYSGPSPTVTFDVQNKMLMVDADTSDGPKVVDIFIPHELLDGKLSILMDGQKVLEGNDSNIYGSIQNGQSSSHITLFPDTNQTKIQVIGTRVVPEFPFAEIVLVVGITSLVVLYRTKNWK